MWSTSAWSRATSSTCTPAASSSSFGRPSRRRHKKFSKRKASASGSIGDRSTRMRSTRRRRVVTRINRAHVLVAALAVALCIPAAGISSSQGIGKGGGQLTLGAWEGHPQPQWVKPFQKATGCQVHAKYAGSSDEMVTLMRQGGGSQYDMVSASGDASLRLIRGGNGNAAPVNVNLIPSYKDFIPQLQSPAHNT